MARIAVAGFQHETNTFSPQKATWDDFVRADAWPPLLRGPEMIEGVKGYNIPIAGAVKGLTELGHEMVPLSWAAAPPCSYVEREAYERIAGMILEDLQKALPVDGIYLDLHGAMVADDYQDGEGELLARIRKLVGPDLPIVCSLDYHANLTPEMAQLSTALIGYRTYPHIDMAATGEKAARLLDRLLREKRKLYKAYRQFDFLIPLVWQCTLNEPSKGLFDMIEEMEQGGTGKVTAKHNFNIVSATITPGFPPADITHCGPGAGRLCLGPGLGRCRSRCAGRRAEQPREPVRRRGVRARCRRAEGDGNGQDGEEADRAGRRAGQSRRRRHLRYGRPAESHDAQQGQGRGDRHAGRSRLGAGGARAGRRQHHGARHRCGGRRRRRDAGQGALARDQTQQRQLHRHRSVLWRRQDASGADGFGDRRGERRVGGAGGAARAGGGSGDVPPCRRRAVAGRRSSG